ncbi:hypothetical protein [Phormidesmis priestleyi]
MVTSFDSSLGTPPLAEAIDLFEIPARGRHPLIVAPDARLSEVAALMHETSNLAHQAQNAASRKPTSSGYLEEIDALGGARSSCVLVMQDQQLLGIFTALNTLPF